MDILDILIYPNAVLRKKCASVPDINDDVLRIAQCMAETMYTAKGVGLAAPQVGITQQIITIDVGNGLITLINPEIVLHEGDVKMEEGCLCLPKITVDIPRYEKVQVRGIDLTGKPITFDAEGLLARAFQHEIDHLRGKLIIDKLSKIKRDLAIKKYKKLNADSKEE
jgi:peptide deformylase